ncbi:hypothetical protein Scep_012014 [Stephania cephalantha]|uniref:Uncharacterized protein n=1 Tax=Stephania cephalantha TaxID=152367 RepID=A0AAP0JE69_9MAGN
MRRGKLLKAKARKGASKAVAPLQKVQRGSHILPRKRKHVAGSLERRTEQRKQASSKKLRQSSVLNVIMEASDHNGGRGSHI